MQAYTWETVPAERLDDNITRRMVVGEKEMLVHWEFKKGAVAARHSHPHEQIVMMVAGKMRFMVGDEETVMGPGDMLVVPSGVPHEGEAIEDTVVIDIFSPPREDFLSSEGPAYMRK